MTLDPTLHPPFMAFLTPWTHRTLPRAYGYTHVHARHRTVENEFPGERERRYVPSYFDSVNVNFLGECYRLQVRQSFPGPCHANQIFRSHAKS